jgi:hypothetical protein
MSDRDNRLRDAWDQLEAIVTRLPSDDTELSIGDRPEWFQKYEAELETQVGDMDESDEPVHQLAEDYLYGRLVLQLCQRLKRHTERQDLEKVREVWNDLLANQSHTEEVISSSRQERVNLLLDRLDALRLDHQIRAARKQGEADRIEEHTLTLVDPELLAAIAKHPLMLKTLDWRDFEKLLAELLARLGYEIELQRGTKDGGVDIFALKRDGVFGKHRYLLQAKRWTDAVGVEPVRELLFLHSHHRMTRSALATTSRFTQGAWELAQQYAWQLELKDYDKLLEWLALAQAARSFGT